jgi:hypothetical protein
MYWWLLLLLWQGSNFCNGIGYQGGLLQTITDTVCDIVQHSAFDLLHANFTSKIDMWHLYLHVVLCCSHPDGNSDPETKENSRIKFR